MSDSRKEIDSTYSFLKKVLIFVLITLTTILVVIFVGQAINTLLLIFAGILLAMPLMGCVMILLKRFYIQDILGDSLEEQTDYSLKGDTIFKDD